MRKHVAGRDIVDEFGKAIGLTYEEGEPLRVGLKEHERDEHRWELDPASAEDYAERSRATGARSKPRMGHRDQYANTGEPRAFKADAPSGAKRTR